MLNIDSVVFAISVGSSEKYGISKELETSIVQST